MVTISVNRNCFGKTEPLVVNFNYSIIFSSTKSSRYIFFLFLFCIFPDAISSIEIKISISLAFKNFQARCINRQSTCRKICIAAAYCAYNRIKLHIFNFQCFTKSFSNLMRTPLYSDPSLNSKGTNPVAVATTIFSSPLHALKPKLTKTANKPDSNALYISFSLIKTS